MDRNASAPGQVCALLGVALHGALPVADVRLQLPVALLLVRQALLGIVQRLPEARLRLSAHAQDIHSAAASLVLARQAVSAAEARTAASTVLPEQQVCTGPRTATLLQSTAVRRRRGAHEVLLLDSNLVGIAQQAAMALVGHCRPLPAWQHVSVSNMGLPICMHKRWVRQFAILCCLD